MSDNTIGIIIILGIIFVALFGGVKGASNNGLLSSGNATPEQKIQTAQSQVKNLEQQLQIEEDKKNHSTYYGIVTMGYVNRSTDVSQEYLSVRVNITSDTPKNILVTGWTIKSLSSGNTVTIPKGTYLFFTGVQNVDQDIYLTPGDTMYVVTGVSPNGMSFRINKCSGYLTQFQTFTPYISNECPEARKEDLSGIPKIPANDACFDYIDSMWQCKTQTDNLPIEWGAECRNFITKKLNYPSCLETHKDDADFYLHEWRVYLKRNSIVWKREREDIVLYDNFGKVVSELKY